MILISTFRQKFSKISKFRDQYAQDYQYFQSLPKALRNQQLLRILQSPKNNKDYDKQIPKFPITKKWIFNNNEYQVYIWEPKITPKALMLVHHGLNAHTNQCGLFAQRMSQKGILVAGYDYYNFGGSSGSKRGLLYSFNDVVKTSEQFMLQTIKLYKMARVYVQGLSLGGSITYHLGLKHPNLIKGAIFFSPAFGDNRMDLQLIKKLCLISGILLPPLKLLPPRDQKGSKYNLQKFKQKDPLFYRGRIWTTTISQLLLSMRQIKKNYQKFNIPYLLVQSGTDKITNPFQSINFHQLSTSKDKTIVFIKDMWHSMYFDDYLQDTIKICQEWMDQRL